MCTLAQTPTTITNTIINNKTMNNNTHSNNKVTVMTSLINLLFNSNNPSYQADNEVDAMSNRIQYTNEYEVDLNSNHPVYSDATEDEQFEAEIDALYADDYANDSVPMSLPSDMIASIMAFAAANANNNNVNSDVSEESAMCDNKCPVCENGVSTNMLCSACEAKMLNESYVDKHGSDMEDDMDNKFSVIPVLAFAVHNVTFPILGVLLLLGVWFAMKKFFKSNTFYNLKEDIMDSYEKLTRTKTFASVGTYICNWVEPNGQGYSSKFKAAWAMTTVLVLSATVMAQLETSSPKTHGREVSIVEMYSLQSETNIMLVLAYGLLVLMVALTVLPAYFHMVYHKQYMHHHEQQKMMQSVANNLFFANAQAAKEIITKTMSQINTIEEYNAFMKFMKVKIGNVDSKHWDWMMDRGSPDMFAEFFLVVASPEGYRAWQQKQMFADRQLANVTNSAVQIVHHKAVCLFNNAPIAWFYLCTAKERELISTVPPEHMAKIANLVENCKNSTLARVKLMTAMIKDKAFAEKMFAFQDELIAYEYKTQQSFWENKEITHGKSELKSADWVVFIERYRKMMVLARQLMPVFADAKVIPPSEDIAVAFTAAKPNEGIKMSLADTAAIIDALGKGYEYVLRVRQVDADGVLEESKIINAKYFAPDDMGQYCTGRGYYQIQMKDGTIKPWIFDSITLENGNLCYEPYGVLLTVSAGVKDYGLGPENRAARHANVMNALFGNTSTVFNDAQQEVLRVAANWFTHKEWNPNKAEAAVRANLEKK